MDRTNKTAVVYFSLTGHSQRLATRLARALGGELIALNAPSYRSGLLGYLHAGFDSVRKKCVLAPQRFTTLADFDRLVLCGPVWTSYPATPLRALLRSDIDLPASVNVFLTTGSQSSAEKALTVAEQDLGRALTATAFLVNSAEGTEQENTVVEAFLRTVGAVAQDEAS
ncbi:flavodoxin family protein [Roseobacter weihaiensis]|uniref:flavodoxin family protein n=1 Tax=Roseobacter weihaiensis TaxID=2763262 RepID=UPI001D0B932C|nr:hypothetical protein [Roseobacter sp. H9]